MKIDVRLEQCNKTVFVGSLFFLSSPMEHEKKCISELLLIIIIIIMIIIIFIIIILSRLRVRFSVEFFM